MTNQHYQLLTISKSQASLAEYTSLLRNGAPLEFDERCITALHDLDTILQEQQWNVILCDFDFVMVRAAEIVQAVRIHQPYTPLIFVAETATVEVVVEMLRLGACGFVTKANPQRLLEIVQEELHKQASESDPRENADWFRMALEASNLGKWQYDVLTNMVRLDERAQQHYGFDVDTVTLDSILGRLHPDDVAQLQTEIANALSPTAEGRYTTEFRIVHPDGAVHWVAIQSQVYFVGEGAARTPRVGFGTSQDITERKNIEAALRASEERYRSIVEDQTELVCRYDANLRVTFGNTAYCRSFGIDPQNIIGQSIWEKIPAAQRAATQQHIQSLTQAQPIAISVHQAIQPDGSLRWTEWKDRAIFDEQGNIIEYQGIGRDITEQKRAEEARLESERRLQLFIEHAPAAIAMLDKNMCYLAVSRRWLTDYRLQEERIIGHSHYEVFPEIPERWKVIHQRCLAGASEKNEADLFLRADGKLDWVRWEIHPWYNGQGTVGGILMFTEVITERIQSEAALRESEKRYRQMFELHILPKLIIEPDTGQIIDANSAAARFYGYDVATLKTMSIFNVNLSPRDEIDQKLAQAANSEILSCEVLQRGADGQPRVTEVFIGALELGGRNVLYSIVTDVTEKRQAQMALQDAYNLLEQRVIERTAELERTKDNIEAIFNYSGDGILLLDTKYRIQQTNRTFNNLVGENTADYFDVELTTFLAPTEATDLKIQIQKVIATHQTQHIEAHIQRADGIKFPVEISLAPVISSDDTVTSLVCIVRDIIERKQVELALQQYAAEVHDLYNNAPVGYHSLDQNGLLVQINDTELRWLGYTREEVVGRLHITEMITPASAAIFQKNFPVFKTQGWINDVELEIKRKDGSTFPILLSATAIYDIDGQMTHSRSIMYDITKRKQAEKQVIALTQRLQLATETGGIGIWDWDVQNDHLLWDDQMLALYGITREQFGGTAQSIGQSGLLHPDDYERLGNEVNLALQGMKLLDTEFRIVLSRDVIRYIKMKAIVFRDEVPQPIRMIGVCWDITLLKQAEENLRLALEKEKELGELKSRFVSMASHEFRNPLAAILAAAETIAAYRERMEAPQIDARLDKIRQQVLYMKDILDSVLQLARIQEGRVEFKPLPADVDKLCREIIEEFESQPEHQTRINYVCINPPIQATFDERLIRHIISNLISNALKYSEKTVQVTLRQEATQWLLIVQDEGIGIPPDDLKHLFEPFHRATNVGLIPGTGLGLSITRQAVELHGGTITPESEVNCGTTFTVTMPLIPANTVHQNLQ